MLGNHWEILESGSNIVKYASWREDSGSGYENIAMKIYLVKNKFNK